MAAPRGFVRTVPAVVTARPAPGRLTLHLDLGWSVFVDRDCRITDVVGPHAATADDLPVGLPAVFTTRRLPRTGRPVGGLVYGYPPARAFVWTVPGVVTRVVDGDTVRITLELGGGVTTVKNCRIAGVNAPEVATAAGREARDWAVHTLPAGTAVVLASHRLDKYGRPYGDLRYAGHDFGTDLVAAGMAVAVDD